MTLRGYLGVVIVSIVVTIGLVVVITPNTPATSSFRLFRIGSERVNQITVCGDRVRYVGRGRDQMCVAVLVGSTWTTDAQTNARAIVCGTHVYAADTGQPCN